MRFFFLYILALFGISANVLAQDAFYYFGTEKIPLTQVSCKVVVRMSLSENVPMLQSGMRVVNTISDSRQRLMVCETDAPNESARKTATVAFSDRGAVCMPCYTDAQGFELWPTGHVSVKLKSADDISLLQSAAKKYGLDILEQDKFMPLWYLLQCGKNTDMSPIDAANSLQESGDFATASPDFACSGAEISYDPHVHKQWNLYNAEHEGYDINVSPAWNYATGRGVKIAIVDNGVDIRHKDLVENCDSTLTYDAKNKEVRGVIYKYEGKVDAINHGTHCAGIAAAVKNNGICGTGVAPDATIMAVATDYSGISLANGINWAWRNGADVISCSWGCMPDSHVKEALDSAIIRGRNGKGCVIVKSAGNNGKSNGAISWPGSYREEILAVAAMKRDGSMTEDSSFGDALFVTAPGDTIMSTFVYDDWGMMSGTSMAAPHVSGVAALVLERNPKLTAAQVRTVIARTARKVGRDFRNNYKEFEYDVNKEYGSWNMFCGYGLVDAYEAVLLTPRY